MRKSTIAINLAATAHLKKPKELFRRGLLAPSLVAHILVAKYRFGIPFFRLSKMLSCDGLQLDNGTMCRYAEDACATLAPIASTSSHPVPSGTAPTPPSQD